MQKFSVSVIALCVSPTLFTIFNPQKLGTFCAYCTEFTSHMHDSPSSHELVTRTEH